MVSDTRRLLIIIIIINMIMGISLIIYESPQDIYYDEYDDVQFLFEGYGTDIVREGEISASGNIPDRSSEPGFLNTIALGRLVFRVLANGLTPVPLKAFENASTIETIMLYFMNLFRGLMYILIIMELVSLRNKKTS